MKLSGSDATVLGIIAENPFITANVLADWQDRLSAVAKPVAEAIVELAKRNSNPEHSELVRFDPSTLATAGEILEWVADTKKEKDERKQAAVAL